MEVIKWTGLTANTALASSNRKGVAFPDDPTPKAIQASGPASGSWSATVKVYRSLDGVKDVLAATLSISNSAPSDMVEVISICGAWNFSVESVTGTVPTTPDADGQSGITISVGS